MLDRESELQSVVQGQSQILGEGVEITKVDQFLTPQAQGGLIFRLKLAKSGSNCPKNVNFQQKGEGSPT